MKIIIVILFFFITGCSEAAEKQIASSDKLMCEFGFKDNVHCAYQNMQVNVIKIPIAFDEARISQLNVNYFDNFYVLNVSKDTTIINGDKGYILFDDINFDGIPDIAITTSFGLANLYMDYWVFDKNNNKFKYVGNFPKFTIDPTNKKLINEVRVSASIYKKNVYSWKNYTLKKMPQ